MLGFNRSPEEIIYQVEYEDAYREGKLAGFEEGYKSGFDEGRGFAFKEGYRLGYKQGIEKILVNILEYGIDPVTISKISKVDLEIISNLKNRNNL